MEPQFNGGQPPRQAPNAPRPVQSQPRPQQPQQQYRQATPAQNAPAPAPQQPAPKKRRIVGPCIAFTILGMIIGAAGLGLTEYLILKKTPTNKIFSIAGIDFFRDFSCLWDGGTGR